MIDPEILNFLSYDPETGAFHWKQDCGKKKAGTAAGSVSKSSGYLEIRFHGKLYRGHFIAWFFVYGVEVLGLDHRNKRRADNRLSNLRESTNTENSRNTSIKKTNKIDLKGVTKHRDKYRATICVDRQSIHLGLYHSPKNAAVAYDNAALHHFGEFAATNQMLGLI